MAKAKFTHDVMATVGTYKDADGNEKKRYLKVGGAFTSDEGNISLKLDAVPCSPEWSGWLSLMKPRENGDRQQSRPAQQRPARPSGPATPEDDDGIPFAPNVC